METSNTTGVNDPQFARAAAERAKNNLDQLIIRTYLGSVYDGSNTMHESLSTAADGANQLGSGINTLHDGANQLHDATKQLVDGTTTLKQGGSQLESGAQQVALGAEQVAQGNEQLASTVSPIAQQASSLLEQAPSAVAALQQMQELVGQCAANNTPQAYCDKLDQASVRPRSQPNGSMRLKLKPSHRSSMRKAPSTNSRKVHAKWPTARNPWPMAQATQSRHRPAVRWSHRYQRWRSTAFRRYKETAGRRGYLVFRSY